MNKGKKGFSLVELLIAMTLLLMITSLGTYGYGLYSRYWQAEFGDFESAVREVKGVTTLFKVLGQLKPYVLLNDKNEPYHYFEGGKSVIRSITSNSLKQPGYPAFFELKVLEESGKQRLIYRERAITGPPPIKNSDVLEYDVEITILEGFRDFSFEYFGMESYEEWLLSQPVDKSNSASWYGYYSGADTMLIPELIRVNIAHDLDLSSIRIQLPDFMEQQLNAYFVGDN